MSVHTIFLIQSIKGDCQWRDAPNLDFLLIIHTQWSHSTEMVVMLSQHYTPTPVLRQRPRAAPNLPKLHPHRHMTSMPQVL
eukprot:m.43770 g.43770  ORF g.43770 m.43770 type:complete len:81 (+) comp8466_c0_seq1:3772-4014(+)